MTLARIPLGPLAIQAPRAATAAATTAAAAATAAAHAAADTWLKLGSQRSDLPWVQASGLGLRDEGFQIIIAWHFVAEACFLSQRTMIFKPQILSSLESFRSRPWFPFIFPFAGREFPVHLQRSISSSFRVVASDGPPTP